jgi:hypothetical protein
MKKNIVVLLVALFSSQIFGQVREACVTFDANRKLQDFKNIVMTWKDPFIKGQLWPEYILLIKNAYRFAGEEIPAELYSDNLVAIKFILNNSYEYERSNFHQEEYENGVRINNALFYRNVLGTPSNWIVFEKGKILCMYAKVGCCNPQRPKVKQREVIKQKPETIPVIEEKKKVVIQKDTSVIKTKVIIEEKPVYVYVTSSRSYSSYYPRVNYYRPYQQTYVHNNYQRNYSINKNYSYNYNYSQNRNYTSSNHGTMSGGSGGSYSSGRGTMSGGYSSGYSGSSYNRGTMSGGYSSGRSQGGSSGGVGRSR